MRADPSDTGYRMAFTIRQTPQYQGLAPPWGGDGGVRGGMHDGAGRGRLIDYGLMGAD